MTQSAVAQIADALMYEGYVLYPYRATTVKNRHRWTIGALVPFSYSQADGGGEPCSLQTECLVRGDHRTTVTVRTRFLHPLERTDRDSSWQEGVEREFTIPGVELAELAACARQVSFAFNAARTTDGEVHRIQHAIEGRVDLSATRLVAELFRVTIVAANHTSLETSAGMSRDAVMLRSLASAHLILSVNAGEFVSLTDPPEGLKPFVDGCRNVGVWPVLVGDADRRDTIIASPIILSDFPRVAPESSGDFFDGTEIDEMLALRIRTLTEEEKRLMAGLDSRARALLARIDAMSDAELARLHGTHRPANPMPGDRVRLRPRGRTDALDLLLTGKVATVVSVEEDFEGRTHLCVTVDDDPGSDLGEIGMPGHRFFYRQDEMELLPPRGEEGR